MKSLLKIREQYTEAVEALNIMWILCFLLRSLTTVL